MHVNVVLHSGTGGTALIEADVEAMRAVDIFQPAHRKFRQLEHLTGRLRGYVLDSPDMLERSDHQVAVRVRVKVQDHEAVLGAVNDQGRFVIPEGGPGAEDAFVLVVFRGILYVVEAPGRPDPVLAHADFRL